jgi:hypothetical protein
LNDNEKEVVNNALSFFRFAIIALLVAGGIIGNEFLL